MSSQIDRRTVLLQRLLDALLDRDDLVEDRAAALRAGGVGGHVSSSVAVFGSAHYVHLPGTGK